MSAHDFSDYTLRNFLERAVEANPNDPFLIWEEQVVSYVDFNFHVDQAAALWYSLGVRHGDCVSFMVDNSPEFLYSWLGLAKIGGVLVAINTGFKAKEAAYLVDHSQSEFALVGEEHMAVFDKVVQDVPRLKKVLTLGNVDGYDEFMASKESMPAKVPDVTVVGDDLISLIYTSGTTGLPKAVMQSHKNYVLTGQAYAHWMGMEKGDRIYACLPLFHINSQAYSTMGAIGAQGALVLAARFSASKFWPDVKRHGVTVFNFIGAMTVILSKKAPGPEDRDHKVRVAYGVPALPHDVRMEIQERFNLDCVSGFGMSETTFGLLEPLDQPRRAASMGLPRSHPSPDLKPTEVMVIDEDGNRQPPGTVGELVLRNEAMMLGYFRDPEKTEQVLRDGWLRTGDSAWMDEDGWYYFVDRMKDIVRRRGENVSSLEVELVLNSHDDVMESAVIGVPSELTDEDILAFVVPKPGHDVNPAEVIEWAQERLAFFKIPRYVEVLDALPKTPTAKIEKHRLRSGDYSLGTRVDLGVTRPHATKS
jgi:crotonobetaine/carnitine-CoA ligase